VRIAFKAALALEPKDEISISFAQLNAISMMIMPLIMPDNFRRGAKFIETYNGAFLTASNYHYSSLIREGHSVKEALDIANADLIKRKTKFVQAVMEAESSMFPLMEAEFTQAFVPLDTFEEYLIGAVPKPEGYDYAIFREVQNAIQRLQMEYSDRMNKCQPIPYEGII
jgi:hypothetical protein